MDQLINTFEWFMLRDLRPATLHDTRWLRLLKGDFLRGSFPAKERALGPQSDHRPRLDALSPRGSEQDPA